MSIFKELEDWLVNHTLETKSSQNPNTTLLVELFGDFLKTGFPRVQRMAQSLYTTWIESTIRVIGTVGMDVTSALSPAQEAQLVSLRKDCVVPLLSLSEEAASCLNKFRILSQFVQSVGCTDALLADGFGKRFEECFWLDASFLPMASTHSGFFEFCCSSADGGLELRLVAESVITPGQLEWLETRWYLGGEGDMKLILHFVVEIMSLYLVKLLITFRYDSATDGRDNVEQSLC